MESSGLIGLKGFKYIRASVIPIPLTIDLEAAWMINSAEYSRILIYVIIHNNIIFQLEIHETEREREGRGVFKSDKGSIAPPSDI